MARTRKTAASVRLPAPRIKLRPDRPPRINLARKFSADKNPTNAEKKQMRDTYAHPEGLTLATKKNPRGIEDKRNPRSGIAFR
jgi:hypothetical protein